MKPESYPFLRIARQYGVPYDDVLKIANCSRLMLGAGVIMDGAPIPIRVYDEVVAATNVQERIRRGLIDWQTGAPIAA